MDKETLSNYGWIVICVLVIVVMIALATPFGSFISQAIQSTTQGLFDVNQTALEAAGVPGLTVNDQTFDVPNMIHGEENGGTPEINIDMSTVSTTLKDNDWETIQNVIKAGKVEEAGWKVGDKTAAFTINGSTKTATIIGINEDGNNTVTFMLSADITNGGGKTMNGNGLNANGYKDSDIRTWLNGDVFNSLPQELQDVIKPVEKTVNLGYNTTGTVNVTDKIFLLSVEELGLTKKIDDYGWTWYNAYKADLANEGTTYTYFNGTNNASQFGDWFWLRSAMCSNDNSYFGYSYGGLGYGSANYNDVVIPAFVIG